MFLIWYLGRRPHGEQAGLRVGLSVKTIWFFAVSVAFSVSAQPPPPNPLGLRPPGSASAPAVPVSPPAVPPVPLASTPAIPVTNAFTDFAFTNQFGTNFTAGNLPVVLANLQNDLNQALTLLAEFNANLGLGGGQGLQLTTTPDQGAPGGPANFAQNLASSAGANLSANLAANVATPTAPNTVGTPALAPPPTGVTNALGLSTSFGGGIGTNISSQTVAPDTARLLIMLQNDMERLLPNLAAFTGGSIALPSGLPANSLNTNPPGTFITNQFVFPRTTTATRSVTPQPLTPTGQ